MDGSSIREQIQKLVGTAAERHEPNDYERAILAGLQLKATYQGTVDPVTVAERRARNKRARKSRRINQLAAKR